MSTKKLSSRLLQEIVSAIKNIKGYGSVEIYIQNFKVVQITERNIKKPFVMESQNGQKSKNLPS